MIVEVLKQKATLHENIRVVSNDMIFKDVSLPSQKGILSYCPFVGQIVWLF